MKTTHTPGPWRAEPQPGQTIGVHTYTHMVMYGDDCIASLLTEPDARLIAAAPELLAALDRVIGIVETHAERYPGDRDAQADLAIARSAVAKAKGKA